MYKIIKNGHNFKTTTCPLCQCVFQFEEEDIESKEEARDNQGISWRTDFHLTCPYCKKKIAVSNYDILK